MTAKDLSEDTLDDIVSGSVHCDSWEVALQSQVYCEGTWFVIEATEEQ